MKSCLARLTVMGLVLILLTLSALPTGPVGAQEQADGEQQVVVLFRPDSTPEQRAAALARSAPGARATVSQANSRLVQLRAPAGQAWAQAARLRAEPAVRAAAVDQRVQAAAVPTEYSPTDQPNMAVIDAPAAWMEGRTGRDVTIAVIDSGLDTDHPEFSGRIVAPAIFLKVFGSGCGGTTPTVRDDNGHGTHVAGIAAAGGNNGGIAGLAWEASVMPVKVLDACGGGQVSDIAEGISYAADQGADVINLSVEAVLSPADPNEAALITIIQDAVDHAHSRGSVLVAAAGNRSADIDLSPSYPAASNHVLAVAATTTQDLRASFSNYGDRVDLAAPGANDSAPNAGIYSTRPTYPNYSQEIGYGYLAGTSMAAPHVAGLAALLLQDETPPTPEEVKTILQETAVDLGADGPDPFFGAGRIDAGAAVTRPEPPPPGPEPPPGPGPDPDPDPTEPPVIRYFAEGYTGAGFDTYLTLQNAEATAAVVQLHFQYSGPSTGPEAYYLTLPPISRTTLRLNDIVGAGQEVSTTVATDAAGIFVERSMYFRYRGSLPGGHVSAGAAAPATTWLFAEGYTGPGFEQYFTIQNPSADDARVTITYYLEGGSTKTRTLIAPANRRTTVAVHDPHSPGGLGPDFAISARVRSTNGVGIVVERPMYFTYGDGRIGGSVVVGTQAASADWLFAEGYTGEGFDEYLTIQNPNASAGEAIITYYLEGSAPISRTVALLAHSRTTVSVHEPRSTGNPGGLGRRGVGHAIGIASSLPVVVERPTYFRYRLAQGGVVDGGDTAVGATAPASEWYFPEGYTGPGFDTYLTIVNPAGTPAPVTLTYYLDDGEPVEKEAEVPARQRLTVPVHRSGLGVGRGKEVAMKVATDASGGIVVERVMYFAYRGDIGGGHVDRGLQP
jgi:subtilisin family serine protease